MAAGSLWAVVGGGTSREELPESTDASRTTSTSESEFDDDDMGPNQRAFWKEVQSLTTE